MNTNTAEMTAPQRRKQQEPTYEMRTGADNKMYTLWFITYGMHRSNEQFVQNLGTDHDESLAKAKLIAGDYLVDDYSDDVNDIVRGDDVLRFGKHKDSRVADLPDGYLWWLRGGAMIVNEEQSRHYGYEIKTSLLSSKQCEQIKGYAEQELVKRGLLVEYNGRLISANYLEEAKRKDQLEDGHWGVEKERVELNVTLDSVGFYDNSFGGFYMITLLVGSKKYYYKGSTPPADWHSQDSVGNTYKIVGAIKHGEYNNKKQTFLLRIKVNP